MVSSRGTRSYLRDNSKNDTWIRNKNTVKRISRDQSGQKLTTMRGTNHFWLTDQLKHNPQNPKKITLLVQRGTKKITSHLNSSLSYREPHKNPSMENLTCNTCKREMDSEMCRIVFTRNIVGEPQFFSFHFFSPCWKMEDFCQKYPNNTLDRVGISILENHSISKNGIKDLQTNSSYWVDSKF